MKTAAKIALPLGGLILQVAGLLAIGVLMIGVNEGQVSPPGWVGAFIYSIIILAPVFSFIGFYHSLADKGGSTVRIVTLSLNVLFGLVSCVISVCFTLLCILGEVFRALGRI